MKHLITALDGKTLSNNKWTGNIGKTLDTATELLIDPSFTKLSTVKPPISLRDNVVKSQVYKYRIILAIRTGELPT